MKEQKTIIYVGGGSGGHVTPLLAIHKQILGFDKLKNLNFYLITDSKFYESAKLIFKNNQEVRVKKIVAGKFRRHPNVRFSHKLRLIKYYLKNLVDVFKFGFGLVQSILLMIRLRPKVVISKGGYVAVPLIFAAKIVGAKIIIHDSDTRPGLASKITAKWADKIFTGFEGQGIYPPAKTEWVGIPINELRFSDQDILKFKTKLQLNSKIPSILIIGGGNGSDNLNEIVAGNLKNLLANFNVLHQAGEGKQISFKSGTSCNGRYIQFGFCPQVDMQRYIEIADIVVSRAGATSIQELAFKSKATIIIASPYLSDQIKNADYLKQKDAALILNELEIYKNLSILSDAVNSVLKNKDKWGRGINKIYMAGAAKKIADYAISLL